MFYPADNLFFFSVYYPDVPMLAQPKEIKMDEELKSLSRSSLANIGTDIKESPYDSVPNYPNREVDKYGKTENVDIGGLEFEKDSTQIDGDATPKVSRVSDQNNFQTKFKSIRHTHVREEEIIKK